MTAVTAVTDALGPVSTNKNKTGVEYAHASYFFFINLYIYISIFGMLFIFLEYMKLR